MLLLRLHAFKVEFVVRWQTSGWLKEVYHVMLMWFQILLLEQLAISRNKKPDPIRTLKLTSVEVY